MKKILIIGGGFGGCACAHTLSMLEKFDITLVERSGELGAGVRTNFWGGHPYTYGPRHFLTKDKKLYDFLDKYIPLRDCSDHKYLSYAEKDDNFYSMPLSYDDVETMPDKETIYKEMEENKLNKAAPKNLEEFWVNSIGSTLYEKTVKNYNKKMWMVEDNKVFTSFGFSTKGDPIKKGKRKAFDLEGYSAYPIKLNGYNDYFDLSTKHVKVLLKTEVKINDLKKKIVTINNQKHEFDYIISTISPDEILDYQLGELNYIGRDFLKIVLPMENCFPDDVYYLYYPNTEPFTRIVEYKKFTNYKSKNTLVGLEIPSKNGKYYPLPLEKEQILAKKYHDEMPVKFFSVGRNGSYRYSVDIDDCIEQAIAVAEIIDKKKWENTIPLEKHRERNFSSMGKK